MVKRFDIFLLNLDTEVSDDPKNSRPCVIISPNEMNRNISSVIVAPISSANKKYPTRVPFEFLEKNRAVILDQIRTVEKDRLVKHIGVIDRKTQARVIEVLAELFAH